jgi:hypothetical protein
MSEIHEVLDKHISFFEDDENKNDFLRFKTEIKNKYNKKFSVKKLFS